MTEKFTYKDAGVDIELADRVIGSLSERIKTTFRSDVIGGIGGFAAMVNPDWSRYENPVLVSATDGVGTKLKLAFLTGIHDTVGIDLVAMSVNDILVTGAEPIFFLDYFATGAIEAETVSSVISGIAKGCELAGCSLIGGETAEMPDFYSPGEYDLAGFCVGIANKNHIIDGSSIKSGDVILGLASSGVHSNGFSLIRKVLLERKGYSLEKVPQGFNKPLGEELLTPTQIYVKPVLDILRHVSIRGIVHITGGGFYGNIPRVLPDSCNVVIHKNSWEVPPIFDLIGTEAGLDDDEMFRTFNMGVGLMLIVPETQADKAISLLNDKGMQTWTIGNITERGPNNERVHLK